MNRAYLLPVLAMFSLPSALSAQSTTPVIGYYKFDVPPGTSAWTCGFVAKVDYQSAMTGRALTSAGNPGANPPVSPQSSITVTGTPWTGITFGNHYAEIISGPQAGLVLDIVANTANQLTVLGDLTSAPLQLTGSETFAIRRHATMATVFDNGGGLTPGADTVTLSTQFGTKTFTYNGSNWEDADLNDVSGEIIYPGQGFLIFNGGAADVVTFGGNEIAYVKNTPTKIPLFPGIVNLVGLPSPLVATKPADPIYNTAGTNALGDLGFVSSLLAGADTLDLRSLTGDFASAGTFQSNGGNLEDADLNDGSPVRVRNGAAYILTVSGQRIHTFPLLTPAN
ncbi:MAG: hypothetical protein ACK5CW_06095 [Verrucomicrobiota bacterium]